MNSKIEKVLEHEIDTLNDHLPRARIRLADLLKEKDPHFITRCGDKSIFKSEELEWLRTEIPSQFHNDIRLPIVLLRRLDQGQGIHSVSGNKVELFLIHKILGYDDLEWENFTLWEPIEHLARPQVQIIRRKLPSTTVLGIVFVTSKDSKKNDALNG